MTLVYFFIYWFLYFASILPDDLRQKLVKIGSKQPTVHQSASVTSSGNKFQIVYIPAPGMFQCCCFKKYWKSLGALYFCSSGI